MRIAHVLTRGDSIGGAQIHVRDLAASLARRGHAVTVFMGRGGPLGPALAEVGVPAVALRHLVPPIAPLRDARAVRELVGALAAFRPDLVAIHSSKAGVVARLAARWLGLPTVFTAHGWAFTEGAAPARRAYAIATERALAPLADRVICVSDYDRDLALRLGVGDRTRLTTVHNGVPEGPVPLADPAAEPARAIMVARLDVPKDHALVLEALAGVPGLGLDLLGDGPHGPDLARRAGELDLASRVRFLGYDPRVPAHLAACQIFVLASRYEGFPLSVLEAMRAGLPVVASDVGGVHEAVVDGETGFLIPKGDVRGWREALARLASDPALRSRLGAAGRARFLARFTNERMVDRTIALYEQARDRRADRLARGVMGGSPR